MKWADRIFLKQNGHDRVVAHWDDAVLREPTSYEMMPFTRLSAPFLCCGQPRIDALEANAAARPTPAIEGLLPN